MENEKHTGQVKPKDDKKDAIIRRYVAESKILKLIDRMCNGETLNTDQYITIFDYIKKKGHSTVSQEEWHVPVWGETGIAYHRKETRDRPGYRYLGIFATTEGNEMVLRYGDTRQCKITSLTRHI